MTNEEMYKMCRSLARKYNDPQEYDDLVSEGVIKCLELQQEGKTDKRLLYSHAQSAMYEYYNLKNKSVAVPNSSKAYSMGAEDEVEGWTSVALQHALYGENVEYEEYMSQTPSTEDLYEHKEWLAFVASLAITKLSESEWKIVKMRFWDDMTQEEVAKVLQISQQGAAKREKIALDKLFRLLETEKSCYR